MAEHAHITRRFILKAAMSGAAATMPVPALAALNVPPTDEEQLEACIQQMRAILGRMHPNISVMHKHYLSSRQDGSFRFHLQGDVRFEAFQGDGRYLVSLDGYVSEYLVREEPVVTVTGKSMGWSHYFGRARCDDGGWDHVERFLSPNFVRKLAEVSAQ